MSQQSESYCLHPVTRCRKYLYFYNWYLDTGRGTAPSAGPFTPSPCMSRPSLNLQTGAKTSVDH